MKVLKSILRSLFLPFLTALLFWASFPPLDLGFLGWIALVPLTVHAIREAKTSTVFFSAWVGGFAFCATGFSWLHYNVPYGHYPMGVYMGVYFALYAWLVRRLSRAFAPMVVVVPLVWVTMEYAKSHVMTGVPWYLLGYTQHELGTFIQTADLLGVWGVSAVVAFVNGVFARAFLSAETKVWQDKEFRLGTLGAGVLLLGSLVYGIVRINTMELRDGPELVVVQPNIPQSLKLLMKNESTRKRHEIYWKHYRMTEKELERGPSDLVVWPESVLYDGLYYSLEKKEFDQKRGWYKAIVDPANDFRTPLLLGSEFWEYSGEPDRVMDIYKEGRVFVAAVLVEPDKGITARYDKIHLVPYAEFFLFGDTFPFLREWGHEYIGEKFIDFKRGSHYTIMEAGKGTTREPFGTFICFENCFPEISREFARNGATFVVNISNEGWFEGSQELDQMFIMARFRSIESRLGYVRGTNTGISAFIAPTGSVDEVLEVNGARKEVAGVLRRRVRVTDAGSLYRKLGDAGAWFCVGLVLVAFFLSWLRKPA